MEDIVEVMEEVMEEDMEEDVEEDTGADLSEKRDPRLSLSLIFLPTNVSVTPPKFLYLNFNFEYNLKPILFSSRELNKFLVCR